MIRSKGLNIFLLGFLTVSIGCVSSLNKTLDPGSPDDLPGCYAVFPREPWESVHRIEATIQGGGSSSLLGVTKGEPFKRRLQSLLLSPEGFILFDAELSEDGLAVRKAVAPFDSPAFAKGLMEDVSLLFLPPQIEPAGWRKEMDGTMVCEWQSAGDSHTDITGSMDGGWRILRRNKKGKVIKELVLNGLFVNGLASRVELCAFEPPRYRLRMTLIETSP